MSTEALNKLLRDNPALYKALMAQVACEKSLYKFTETMWEFVEPANPFIGNWHLQAICSHLEAVSDGHITRLLINVPPGTMKSLMTDVFWPAWEWIQKPHTRYLCTSYSAALTERDNIRFRQVITSDLYRAMWGDKFGFSRDSFNVTKIGNDKTGWKIATSSSGMGTGERANRVICILRTQKVLTENGPITIGDIVDKKIPVRVMSMNTDTGIFSWKKITEWKKNPGSEIIEVIFDNGETLKCTPDHKVWTSNRRWVRADSLLPSDVLPCAPTPDLIDGILIHPEHTGKINLTFAGIKDMAHLLLSKMIVGGNLTVGMFSIWLRNIAPCPATPNGIYKRSRNPIALCDIGSDTLLLRNRNSYLTRNFPVYLSIPGNMRTVPLGIGNILLPRSVINILNAIVGGIPVLMASIMMLRPRTNKSQRHHLMNPKHLCYSIFSCIKSLVSPAANARGCFHNLLRDRKISRTPDSNASMGFYAPHIANAIQPFKSGYCSPLLIRKICHVDETFCLTVEDNHTFCVGESQYIVVSNCDDLHNVSDGESDLSRKSTLQYFTEVLPTRVTDPMTSAMIVIMQRVHEGDVSGHILANDLGYTHLMLPMEFEPERKCYTFLPGKPDDIFFEDPRTKPGELLFPARMPEWVVERDKKAMGPYAISGQFQQSPSPRGGGIIKRDYWKLWPPSGEEFDSDGTPLKKTEYPIMDFIVASTDTAYTSQTSSDYNALAILGVWKKNGLPKIMLMHCWQKRLDFRGEVIPRLPDESDGEYSIRKRKGWGMLEWTAHECHRFAVDKLLIEGKATGITLAQEIKKVYRDESWSTQLINPKGDKEARVYSIQHLFAEGMVYAPDREWAEMAISECFVGDTLIYTESGVKRIDQISPGERVMTHKGRFRTVLHVMKRQTNKLEKISAKTMDVVYVTPEHPFLSGDFTCERKLKNVSWVKASDLMPREYRSTMRNGKKFAEAHPSRCHSCTLPVPMREQPIDEIDLRDWATGGIETIHDLYSDDEFLWSGHSSAKAIKWNQPLDFSFGRVMGLYLAEGSGSRTHRSWSFNAKKEQHLVLEVSDFAKKRLGIDAWSRTQNNCSTVSICIPIIDSFFDTMGKHAHNKKIPEWMWQAPDEFLRGVVSGYAEGDGCDMKTYIACTTVSQSLAWGIRLMLARLGVHASVIKHYLSGNKTTIQGRECKLRDKYMIRWVTTAKNKGAAFFDNNLLHYSIMKKESLETPSVDVYNLHVNEDNSYLTTGGIVHNCEKFPKGKNDDIVDAIAQGCLFLRQSGFALRRDEVTVEENARNRHTGRQTALYDV